MTSSIETTPKGAFKTVLHFASFCNILLNFSSHNDGCKLPSSLPHELLAEWKVQYIVETQRKISIGPTPKDACKVVLYFANFCNILLNFGSHNYGCKLLSSLPHEWLAEWKKKYVIETERKVLLMQLLKAHLKLCCILQVSATLVAILMAVSFPRHCHMSGWLSGMSGIL